jgi:Fe2+ transport system protein B
MFVAIILIAGLVSFFYLVFKSIPEISNHVADTFSKLIPSVERVFSQLSPETFKTLSGEQKYYAIGGLIIHVLCFIALIVIYKVFF